MKINQLIKLLILPAVIVTGCSDDDCNLGHPIDQFGLPAIKQGTFPTSDISMSVGETYVFEPQILTSGDIDYKWYLNNEEVSNKESFSFTAENSLRSKLVLELRNTNGLLSLENKINVPGDSYKGKYLIINEGWYGNEPGSISVLDPNKNTISHWNFKHQNYGSTLGITSQSATLWEEKLYVTSKNQKGLAVINPETFYMEKEINGNIASGRQAYEFIGINKDYGLLTANADIYRVDLNTMELKWLSFGNTWGGIGSGTVYGDKILLNLKNQKIYVLDVAEVTSEISGSSAGKVSYTTLDITTNGGTRFVKGADGNMYTVETTGSNNNLVRIKPDLSIEKAAMRSDYSASSFGAYKEASFCGTGADNNFYYVAAGKIYKCSFTNAAPEQPFISYTKEGYELYGAGIRVNPANNELVATYVTTDYQTNLIVRFDGNTGEVLSEIEYEHYWFPATLIFNN